MSAGKSTVKLNNRRGVCTWTKLVENSCIDMKKNTLELFGGSLAGNIFVLNTSRGSVIKEVCNLQFKEFAINSNTK